LAPVSHAPTLATKELALRMVADALNASGEAHTPELYVTEGPDQGQRLLLQEFERTYVIGRLAEADLPLQDDDASRRHVSVERRGAQIVVQDLGSKNGSTLGEQRVPVERATAWNPKVLLVVGANTLQLSDPVRAALRELETSPDEPLRGDAEGPVRAEPTQPSPAEDRSEPPADEPRKARSMRPEPNPVPDVRTKWDVGDALVLMLAVGVLVLSAIGLIWVFGTN
jgi:hypothetical protein